MLLPESRCCHLEWREIGTPFHLRPFRGLQFFVSLTFRKSIVRRSPQVLICVETTWSKENATKERNRCSYKLHAQCNLHLLPMSSGMKDRNICECKKRVDEKNNQGIFLCASLR